MASIDSALLPVFLRVLRHYGRVTFVLADDLGTACGFANFDDGTIVLDARNSDGAMAATIGHELFHLDDPDAPEDMVEYKAARTLVPLESVLGAELGDDFTGLAELLGVDQQLIRARVRGAGGSRRGRADGVG